MVESGLARGPVNSNQGAPCFLIPRKDPTKPARLIVSLTRENACLVDPPQLVLPSTDKVLSKLGGGIKYFTSIDLRQGFYNLKIAPEDTYKSTVCLLYTSPSPRDRG